MVRKMEGRLILAAVVLTALTACGGEMQEHTAPAIHDRDSVSMMTSYGVNTLISDSGVIKYRIVTERWDVNTVRVPSRWTFEKGVFFEQFDEKFHVQAYIQADTAWYYDQKKLWHLRGRVRIRNINGLIYTSEELFWAAYRMNSIPTCFQRWSRRSARWRALTSVVMNRCAIIWSAIQRAPLNVRT